VRPVEPWWLRWRGWWHDQLRYLRGNDLKTIALARDREGHRAIWHGTLVVDGLSNELMIEWGPGTPFFPPRIIPVEVFSAVHQLADRSLCLATPATPENGWFGVLDLGFWLERTHDWLRRYRTEGWAVPIESWPLIAAGRPHAYYRLHLPPSVEVAVPKEWRELPAGTHGHFRALVPSSGSGLAAVTSWDIGSSHHESPIAASLVRGEAIEIEGLWNTAFGGESPTDLIAAPLVPEVSPDLLRGLVEIRGPGRPVAVAVGHPSFDRENTRSWVFLHFAEVPTIPPSGPPGSQQFLKEAFEFLGRLTSNRLPTIWRGFSVDSAELSRRRIRTQGTTMTARLHDSRVVLIGLGALGSEVAHLLAQEGVGRFLLVDADLLLPGNVARHRCELSDSGKPKAEAMREHILRINPDAQVDVQVAWVDQLVPQFQSPPPDANILVVGATGDEASEHLIADLAASLRTPALHGWLEAQGRVLRLIRTLPDRDPSLVELSRNPECLPFVSRAHNANIERCADNILPGAASTLHAAANLIVRIALRILAGQADAENHWLFAPDGISGDDRMDPALQRTFGLLSRVLPLHPGQEIMTAADCSAGA
jgi:molybdopterin/thiamine biosynthesis adenylyltransferase